MKNRKWYVDCDESRKMICDTELKKKYGSLVASGAVDPDETPYCVWIGQNNQKYMEAENRSSYWFRLTEKVTKDVYVKADSYESALKIMDKPGNGIIVPGDAKATTNRSFVAICPECGEEFDADEVQDFCCADEGSGQACMYCSDCISDLEQGGELTRCEHCAEVFSPSRLKLNIYNNEVEICPYCGEIWCP